MTNSFIQIVGISASVFTGVSLLPQLITIIKEKKAQSISMFTVVILMIGLALWVAYGFEKKDLILIIANIFSLAVNFLIVIFTIKYRERKKL